MSDLISRQAVNTLVDELARAISDERSFLPRGRSTGEIMSDILNLPPVENKGEWILDETDNSATCKDCGCSIYPNDISNGEAHFCPNCGADMREPKGEKGTE